MMAIVRCLILWLLCEWSASRLESRSQSYPSVTLYLLSWVFGSYLGFLS